MSGRDDTLLPATRGLTEDPWPQLAALTPARLALGRAGSGLPTPAVLGLAMAHARARDAVHTEFSPAPLAGWLTGEHLASVELDSAAPNREVYLRRPDLGRQLSVRSRATLTARGAEHCDVCIVVCDGLSATAVAANVIAVLDEVLPALRSRGMRLAPVCLVGQGRVAIGDEIGGLLRARLTLMLIGERPGLSAADSLGAYLTFGPRSGRTDAERNCVSNIREAGLRPEVAAAKIVWLIERAFTLGMTGVGLKDESGGALLAHRDATLGPT